MKNSNENIFGGNPKKNIEIINDFVVRNDKSYVNQIVDLLRSTDNNLVRNAAALALTDWKNEHAFEVILDLIKDKKTINDRGTLLYAIGNYDCSSIILLLIDLVIEGNFEVSNQAFSLIRNIDTSISNEDWESSYKRIKSALSFASEERSPILKELLSLFENQ